ncbi:hypothetical protein EJ02DRAFT_343978 [Clathrospora elynae]|uniref:Uncharacterized protein n=1 Tax=Clathrospora elynae TaxID=706981 RepID=A0A6A5SR27_9PLEO|nr:hypothetical protein EJ02DRAFT_343978 [Clathrospora elynae]
MKYFCFPKYQGSGAPRPPGCSGIGANRTWESLMVHGRGLAPKAPWQKQSQSTSKTPFPPSFKLAVNRGQSALPAALVNGVLQPTRSALKVGHERFVAILITLHCREPQRQPWSR